MSSSPESRKDKLTIQGVSEVDLLFDAPCDELFILMPPLRVQDEALVLAVRSDARTVIWNARRAPETDISLCKNLSDKSNSGRTGFVHFIIMMS